MTSSHLSTLLASQLRYVVRFPLSRVRQSAARLGALPQLTLSGLRLGIGLFTYHKYRKSMNSSVPLDVHGNPVTDEDGDVEDGSLLGSGHETTPLVLSSTEQFDRVSLLIIFHTGVAICTNGSNNPRTFDLG